MQKLFKNAFLVDIEKATYGDVDILVENGKVLSLKKRDIKNFAGEVEDLCGNFVLPSFVNCFCDSLGAGEKCFQLEAGRETEQLKQNFADLMIIKNLLAGSVFVNDISQKNCFKSVVLENMDEREENELTLLSDEVAKNQNLLMMKIGQTLNELGTVDKNYGKPISQVLEEFGFLDRNAVVVGGNCLEKDELTLFAQYDCPFVTTPSEDGRCGRRPANLTTLKTMNYLMGIGGGQFFETDFFAFARQILMQQWGLFEDVSVFSEKEVLRMMFEDSARILGVENGLSKGFDATFIVVEKGVSLRKNILETLVWEKSKRDVKLVVKKGEILQKNGKIFMKNIKDYDTIIREIECSISM